MPKRSLLVLSFLSVGITVAHAAVAIDKSPPLVKGETITYNIKKMGIRVGEAALTFAGNVKLDGRDCQLVIFRSQAVQFYDEETICLDPVTFLPLVVKRDLNIFGKKEKIFEEYFRHDGLIRIMSQTGERKVEQVIHKIGNVENIYGFISRYRQKGSFQKGEKIRLILPTRDVTMEVKGPVDMNINDKKYHAFLLQSDHQQYSIWLDDSPLKVPLRIDGAAGAGKTSLIFKEYQIND